MQSALPGRRARLCGRAARRARGLRMVRRGVRAVASGRRAARLSHEALVFAGFGRVPAGAVPVHGGLEPALGRVVHRPRRAGAVCRRHADDAVERARHGLRQNGKARHRLRDRGVDDGGEGRVRHVSFRRHRRVAGRRGRHPVLGVGRGAGLRRVQPEKARMPAGGELSAVLYGAGVAGGEFVGLG